MTKTEKIKRLLEENRKVLLNGEMNNGICFDGIVDENVYINQPLKVVVMLKETNGNDFDGNAMSSQEDFDYVHWLKHQQVNNEPEYRIKGNEKYLETKVFYHHTFKKLCHWLSMLFDVAYNGETSIEKFLKDGKVDVDKVRSILSRVALINLKKTWGREKTDVNRLYKYATKEEIARVLKEQMEILSPNVVLCCSPDVFWIAKELYGSKKDAVIAEGWKEMFFVDDIAFIKLYHPQWYGKEELIIAKEMKDIFNWYVANKK